MRRDDDNSRCERKVRDGAVTLIFHRAAPRGQELSVRMASPPDGLASLMPYRD